MSQDIELYAEKIANAQKRIRMLRDEITRASAADANKAKREIAVIEAILPAWVKFVSFLDALEKTG